MPCKSGMQKKSLSWHCPITFWLWKIYPHSSEGGQLIQYCLHHHGVLGSHQHLGSASAMCIWKHFRPQLSSFLNIHAIWCILDIKRHERTHPKILLFTLVYPLHWIPRGQHEEKIRRWQVIKPHHLLTSFSSFSPFANPVIKQVWKPISPIPWRVPH